MLNRLNLAGGASVPRMEDRHQTSSESTAQIKFISGVETWRHSSRCQDPSALLRRTMGAHQDFSACDLGGVWIRHSPF